MSGRVESGVLDEGDSAGVPQESFENHFRDMLQATARAGTFVRVFEERALRAQYLFRARLTRACCGGDVRARVWNVSHLMWS